MTDHHIFDESAYEYLRTNRRDLRTGDIVHAHRPGQSRSPERYVVAKNIASGKKTVVPMASVHSAARTRNGKRYDKHRSRSRSRSLSRSRSRSLSRSRSRSRSR